MQSDILTRRQFLNTSLAAGAASILSPTSLYAQKQPKKTPPNIIWIIAEDTSCHFGYQGEKLVRTPNVDKLAKQGTVFNNAYVTCSVCSPSRSAMVTGMYQTTIGAHNHRSGRGKLKINLPEHVKLIPQIFKDAGYYTCNCRTDFAQPGKTDYNFQYDSSKIYDGYDWSNRKPNQPFFAQIQLMGGKYRHYAMDPSKKQISPSDVKLPPYYPDCPTIRKDWADYLNSVNHVDTEVGMIMDRLKKENIADNTVVIFITDHGISHARGKQFLYDEGTKIPFIVWAPGRVKPAAVRNDLIAHIDMAATSLYFAGIDIPKHLQSRPLFGPDARPREYVVSARDRCDETVDCIRSVRKGNFKYIRNLYPQRPYLLPNSYKDHKEIIKTMRKLYAQGKLNATQSLIMAQTRPKEELYNLANDPWEIKNLAAEPTSQNKLKEMRSILNNWIKETADKGQCHESEQMYDSDMKVYLDTHQKTVETLKKNIAIMKNYK